MTNALMIASTTLQGLVVVAIVSSICAPLVVLYITQRLNENRGQRQQETTELAAARLSTENARLAALVKGELRTYLATDNGHTPGESLTKLEEGHNDTALRLDRIEVKLDDHIANGEPHGVKS